MVSRSASCAARRPTSRSGICPAVASISSIRRSSELPGGLPAAVGAQHLVEDLRLALEHDDALHHVLELADVARERVALERAHQPVGEARQRLAVAGRERAQEVRDQRRDLLAPLAQAAAASR